MEKIIEGKFDYPAAIVQIKGHTDHFSALASIVRGQYSQDAVPLGTGSIYTAPQGIVRIGRLIYTKSADLYQVLCTGGASVRLIPALDTQQGRVPLWLHNCVLRSSETVTVEAANLEVAEGIDLCFVGMSTDYNYLTA